MATWCPLSRCVHLGASPLALFISTTQCDREYDLADEQIRNRGERRYQRVHRERVATARVDQVNRLQGSATEPGSDLDSERGWAAPWESGAGPALEADWAERWAVARVEASAATSTRSGTAARSLARSWRSRPPECGNSRPRRASIRRFRASSSDSRSRTGYQTRSLAETCRHCRATRRRSWCTVTTTPPSPRRPT